MDQLSNILKTFNEHFGTMFTDADRVVKRIRDDIAPQVAADVAYKNAKDNTPHTARMGSTRLLRDPSIPEGRDFPVDYLRLSTETGDTRQHR
jgi:hypothetical protein